MKRVTSLLFLVIALLAWPSLLPAVEPGSVTIAGSLQSELGCSGDWQPWCLRSWLQDPDGDGIYSFSTSKLVAGGCECKVAHNETWDENYGAGGVPGGVNVSFTVADNCVETFFNYDSATHILAVGPNADVPVVLQRFTVR